MEDISLLINNFIAAAIPASAAVKNSNCLAHFILAHA